MKLSDPSSSLASGAFSLLVTLTALCASTAYGGKTAIDFPEDITLTGELFPPSGTTFTTSGAAGSLPFLLNLGSLTANSFCMSPNGFVGFSSGSCSIASVPGGSYIAPYFADLGALGLQDVNTTSWSVGQIDTLKVYGTGTSAPIDALRFIWQIGDTNFNIFAEPSLVILNRGGGNFDFDLRYGDADSISSAQQGFVLGSDPGNTLALRTGPFPPTTDYYYCVRGGAVGDCGTTTTPVPEPGTPALLGAALIGLFGLRRRMALALR
jgi:hypothetical protein